MIFFLIIITFIIAFVLLFRDTNHFKLILYIGSKGSGKTINLVRDLNYYYKRGFAAFTTLESIDYPWVTHIDVNEIGEKVFPPYSVIGIDEAGIVYDNRNFKKFTELQRNYYKFQRQYKNVVILTSQTWDIDAKLRVLTDSIRLCSKIGPCVFTRRVKRGLKIKEATAEGESRIADDLKFVPFGWQLLLIRRWSRHYQSYSPPDRPVFVPIEYPKNWRGSSSSSRRFKALRR